MAKLRLGLISADKPVKITIEIAAAVNQDLIAYADALGRQTGETIADPKNLIEPMLIQFMRSDRAFKKSKTLQILPNHNIIGSNIEQRR